MKDLEVLRLIEGPKSDERPTGIGFMNFSIHCSNNAEEVLKKCKEVLQIVLQQYYF